MSLKSKVDLFSNQLKISSSCKILIVWVKCEGQQEWSFVFYVIELVCLSLLYIWLLGNYTYFMLLEI